MAVDTSVHGLRPAPPAAALHAAGYGHVCAASASSPAGAQLQPGSGLLVLPAAHAQLQFFDAARDRHVARLQVRGSTCGGRLLWYLTRGCRQHCHQ